LENFAKMTQWFGPMDGLNLLNRIYEMQLRPWFHGNLSSIQSEDLLTEKAKGTKSNQISASNPGSFAISVLTEEGFIKHYKIFHQPGKGYTLGKEDYTNLDLLIKGRQSLLHLRYPCPKGERYSDSNFWINYTVGDDSKTVISLKQLCFRFIYRNQQLFPKIREVMPIDLTEEFYSTIVNSIISDQRGREFWKRNFLGKDSIPWIEFSRGLSNFLGVPFEEKTESINNEMLRALLADIGENSDDVITIETFSKLLEWFGPLDTSMFERVMSVVSKNWFHGNMSHVQAEKLIQRNSNAKKGTFLIRFSSKNRGYFTITVVGRKKSLLHYRVYYNRNSLEYIMGKRIFRSLEEIIITYHRELSLRYPCPGSKFQLLQQFNGDGDYLSD